MPTKEHFIPFHIAAEILIHSKAVEVDSESLAYVAEDETKPGELTFYVDTDRAGREIFTAKNNKAFVKILDGKLFLSNQYGETTTFLPLVPYKI